MIILLWTTIAVGWIINAIGTVWCERQEILTVQWNGGIQVFDVTKLRVFREDLFCIFVESAQLYHNITTNEKSGKVYVVGSNKFWDGLHMVDNKDLLNPFAEGCYGNDGYTDDTQCEIYNGPDMYNISNTNDDASAYTNTDDCIHNKNYRSN